MGLEGFEDLGCGDLHGQAVPADHCVGKELIAETAISAIWDRMDNREATS